MIRHKSSRYAYSTCILAAAVLIISVPQRAVAALVDTDPVLEVYDDSLTTYLYDVGNGTTLVQGVRPLAEQRGVNLDGSLRLGSTHPMSLQGNPFGEAWNANMMLSGVRLDTGTYVINDVDISLPSPGPTWVIGRSYNARQEDDGGTHLDSGGYQGHNWFQSAHPEIVLFEHPTDDAKDVIYLVYGADRYIEFRRASSTSTEYQSKNGAAGVFEFIEDVDGENSADIYLYTDQRGWQFWFFGFDTHSFDGAGQLWKIVAPKPGTGDHVAWVNDKDDATIAAFDYDPNGIPDFVTDSAGRTYTYTSSGGRLTRVDVTVSGVGLVARVDYAYYGVSESHGEDGDLKLVTIFTPLTEDTSGYDPDKWLIRKKLYRYYKNPYDSDDNPGHDHQIKMIVDFEGYRQYDWLDSDITNNTPFTATDDALKPYSSAYFEYEDSSYKITNVFFNGACGCSGAANGTHKFTYLEDNSSYSPTAGYDTEWKYRTIVERPEATYKTADPDVTSFVTQYFDEVGQPLHRVNSKLTPSDTSGGQEVWATKVVRNSDGTANIYGQITDIHSPANVTAYAHSTGDLTTDTGAGLVTVFTRGTTGVLRGFLQDAKHKTGTDTENVYLDLTLAYISRTLDVGDVHVDRPLISSQRIYTQEITSGTTGSRLTSFGQAWHETVDTTDVLYITPKILTTTFPIVSTGSNGPGGTALESKLYLNEAGQTVWQKTTDAIINYWQYKDDDGRLEKSIQDADTDHTDFAGITVPSEFDSDESGDEIHLVTCFGYVGGSSMGQGEGECASGAGGDSVVTGDGPAVVTYRARLADGRMARLVFPHFAVNVLDHEYYGPVTYTVFNLAGQADLQGVIALIDNSGEYTTVAPTNFVDELKDDPLEAIDHGGTTIGTVEQMSTSIFNETGLVLQQSRAYFDVPEDPDFGEGTEGTDYDATRYAYDAMGRTARIKDPTGTIQRTVYDTLGRTTEQWTGTNDYLWDEGETTGPADMVKTAALEYDSGSDEGNSYLTKQTLFLDDTGSSTRVTTFTNDVRGRAVIQANPASPHVLNLFDNLGRGTAGGLYSSTSGLTVTSDPTSVSTNRLSLNETSYDELGRVFRTKTHKIDMADGSDDDNLQTDNWFDKRGRLIKVDGSQLMKYQYNRLGQQTHQFTLAVDDDDTVYTDAADVTGDIVLQESQTVLQVTTGITLMSAVIDRDHDDFGPGEHTGALDSNADNDDEMYTEANISGRIQISAFWYDTINRLTDSASYGTNGGSDFTRASTVPDRSDTILVTTYAFNPVGTLLSITDPEDLETQYEYDDLGRQTAVINNYVDGSPSSSTGDDDIFTRYVYDDGLRIKLWVDIDGDDVEDAEDQVTTYTYGVSADDTPGPSKFDSGRLLRQIKYPDSSGGTDVVLFAYNALGQQIWSRDQEQNIFQTDYDAVGREEHRRVTTLDAAFDNSVLRITTAYDDLGRIDTVTQYDHATVGSGAIVDEVKYTYDGWGNVTNFEQDHNSAVGASEPVDDYEVQYTYAKATAGRNTIRRTKLQQLYASSIKKTLTYEYKSANGLHDDDVSRVTKVRVVVGLNVTTLATYEYLGVGQIVGTNYPEPDAFSNLYTGSGYVHMDRFNRVTTNRWTKDLATDRDFYDVYISYDRDSSITAVVDNIHVDGSGDGLYDVAYTIDNVNRLTKSQWGDWDGSTLTNEQREKLWTLTQTGNWDIVQLDLEDDGDYNGPGEYNDDRTHNIVNELTARDTDDNGTDDYTLVFDKLGELTDDDEFYEYKYDAFGRLIEVAKTSTEALVVEYTYNGLGHRIGWHYDVDADGAVENTSDDPWYYFAYDESWRIVATYRAADTSPKEQFAYHNAGLGGYGGSSAIDGVILRDKDASTNWEDASDGTLEERVYYCQNWRGDVSVVIEDDADMVEWVKYSSYGIPFGLPKGDQDSDGDLDTTDVIVIANWGANPYDVRADLDLNGVINFTDATLANNAFPITLGWGNLSERGNRKGYGGYELDPVLAYTTWHVRRRVLISDLGRFATRDPIGYAGGMNLYQYVSSNPLRNIDPFGLIPPPGGGGGGGPTGGWGRRTPPDPICPPGRCCSADGGGGGGGCGPGGCGGGGGGGIITPGPIGSGWITPGPIGGGICAGGACFAESWLNFNNMQPGTGGGDFCRSWCAGRHPPGDPGYVRCLGGCRNGSRGAPCSTICGRFPPGAQHRNCMAGCMTGAEGATMGPCKRAHGRCMTGCNLARMKSQNLADLIDAAMLTGHGILLVVDVFCPTALLPHLGVFLASAVVHAGLKIGPIKDHERCSNLCACQFDVCTGALPAGSCAGMPGGGGTPVTP